MRPWFPSFFHWKERRPLCKASKRLTLLINFDDPEANKIDDEEAIAKRRGQRIWTWKSWKDGAYGHISDESQRAREMQESVVVKAHLPDTIWPNVYAVAARIDRAIAEDGKSAGVHLQKAVDIELTCRNCGKDEKATGRYIVAQGFDKRARLIGAL